MTDATGARRVEPPAWMTSFYAKVESKDTEAVLARIAPGGTFRYGSADPLTGHDEIRAGVTGLFTHYRWISHEFVNVWAAGSTLLVEAFATCGCPDGRDITVPTLTIIDHSDGLIDNYRTFIDPTPMQAG
jgi:SnoaL-like domain